MAKTTTKTNTQTKCLKNPTYAIFLKSWWLTHSKFDDRYLTLVILFTQVTLVSLFRSYNQFYRAECITVSGFFKCDLGASVTDFWEFLVKFPASRRIVWRLQTTFEDLRHGQRWDMSTIILFRYDTCSLQELLKLRSPWVSKRKKIQHHYCQVLDRDCGNDLIRIQELQ